MIFILNFKIYKTYSQTIDWIIKNKANLASLAKKTNLVLCPTFLELVQAHEILKDTNISLGAQNMATIELGAFTGQVSAKSLKEIGCTHVILGHAETRKYLCETDNDIAQKAQRAISNGITPIVCIGETVEEYKRQETLKTLFAQLNPIIAKLTSIECQNLIIAYEPIWAIGNDQTPALESLKSIVNSIKEFMNNHAGVKTKVLYGGSIDDETIKQYKNTNIIDGFLVARSGLQIETLKTIIDQSIRG